MDLGELDTAGLVARAASGDTAARADLLERHRDRLRRMVDVRMDRRLAARFDASDVVQEACTEAMRQFDRYLQGRDVPFYTWLRQVAWQRLLQLQREHLQAQKRSVRRENQPLEHALPDESVFQLAEIIANQTSPSQGAIRNESLRRVKTAMDQLKSKDREILVLRHLEQLSVEETADVLGMTPGNVKVRHFRAIQQLQQELGDE